jgi:hypothetical protein
MDGDRVDPDVKGPHLPWMSCQRTSRSPRSDTPFVYCAVAFFQEEASARHAPSLLLVVLCERLNDRDQDTSLARDVEVLLCMEGAAFLTRRPRGSLDDRAYRG